MINLLPYDYKQNLQYARKNYTLIKWLFAVIIAMCLIIVTSFGGVYIINAERAKAESNAKTEYEAITQSAEKAEYDKYKAFKASYDVAVKLLGKQLRYTKIIQDIALILPESVNIDGIRLSPTTSTLTLSVRARNQQDIKQVLLNISSEDNQKQLFPKADIESITCAVASDPAAKPCSGSIKVLLNADSKYYYINSPTKTGR